MMEQNENRIEMLSEIMKEFQSRGWAEKYKTVKDIIDSETVFEDDGQCERIVSHMEEKKNENKREKGYFG